ncbi:MAG TPA: mechanosensitive ion channel protein MscS [Desulfotomaculum sp.]|nr:mechanosensitive ion channel protein MscS [Desulfotomaculum sp.]
MNWKDFIDLLTGWLLHSGLRILLVIAAAFIAERLINTAFKRFEKVLTSQEYVQENKKRVHTLLGILHKIVKVSAFVVAVIIILNELGIDIRPIITAAGIGGLALGFGAQSLVKDVISGFFILLENQIRIGDIVSLNGTSGEVVSINLRTTVLRDLSGVVHIFPNGSITSVSNMTKDWSGYLIDLEISYREDIDYVIGILNKIGDNLSKDPEFKQLILAPLEVLGVNNFNPSGVIIKLMIKTLPLQQWKVGRELRKRIKNTFDELGIEIPYQHITLYWGEEKK